MLKTNRKNILFAWVLLLCFAVGQYMVYAHTHLKQGHAVTAVKTGNPTFKEKCDVCDVMHQTHALITQHVYFTPAVAVACFYVFKSHNIQFIQLVLAAGRAPPVA